MSLMASVRGFAVMRSPLLVSTRSSSRSNSMTLQMGMAEEGGETIVNDSDALVIGVAGTVSNVIVAYSEYVLKTTGCGLPPGPFGLEGAAEGVSYLGVVSIFGWALYSKVKTGGGLPSGPYGLLGLAEGLSFLTVIGGIAIGVLNALDYGFLPGFLPNDQCFGINS